MRYIPNYVYEHSRPPHGFEHLCPEGCPDVFRMVFSGPTGCGKTNTIKNIVFKLYGNYFKYVFLFSGTNTTIEEFREIKEQEGSNIVLKVKDSYDDDLVAQILEKFKYKELYGPNLFIFDDLEADNVLNKRNKKNQIDAIFQRGRHTLSSVMVTGQTYTGINQNLRMKNPNSIFLFDSGYPSRDKVFEEHGSPLSKEQFDAVWQECFQQQYDFLWIDKDKNEKDNYRRFKNKAGEPLFYKIFGEGDKGDGEEEQEIPEDNQEPEPEEEVESETDGEEDEYESVE